MYHGKDNESHGLSTPQAASWIRSSLMSSFTTTRCCCNAWADVTPTITVMTTTVPSRGNHTVVAPMTMQSPRRPHCRHANHTAVVTATRLSSRRPHYRHGDHTVIRTSSRRRPHRRCLDDRSVITLMMLSESARSRCSQHHQHNPSHHHLLLQRPP